MKHSTTSTIEKEKRMPVHIWEKCMEVGEDVLGLTFHGDQRNPPIIKCKGE